MITESTDTGTFMSKALCQTRINMIGTLSAMFRHYQFLSEGAMRTGTFIPLSIVLLGSVCAYMSADVPNKAPLFMSVCVVVFGVIVGFFEKDAKYDDNA